MDGTGGRPAGRGKPPPAGALGGLPTGVLPAAMAALAAMATAALGGCFALAAAMALRNRTSIWSRRRGLSVSACSARGRSSCLCIRLRSATSASGEASAQPSKKYRAPIHSSDEKYEHRARWSETAQTSDLRKADTGETEFLTSTPLCLSFLMHLAKNLW